MFDIFIVVWTVAVLLGVTVYLVGSLVQSVLQQRRTNNVRRIWRNFGLSIGFCLLFLLSWSAQAVAEWDRFQQEQVAHGEPAAVRDFVVEFGQSTLENWQSEFLQLFSFVVMSAVLIHRGSAESKDGSDRIERKVDEILKRLGEEEPERIKTRR
ncbi:MAG TPA: DUF6766 family protein [Actinomycetota bacterium]|nr:DUF6766 family protein [Actinomycetota bacterium]